MTIEQMKQRKKELGYSTEQIAELSGVPVSTVRKIFSGATKSPRRETIIALEKILKKKQGEYTYEDIEAMRPGRYVELIDGYIAGVGSGLLTEKEIDVLMARETEAAYNAKPFDTKAEKKTIEDYENMPNGWRGEYYDGIIRDLASPSFRHQQIVMEVSYQLETFKRAKKHNCEVLIAPLDVQIKTDSDRRFQPDIIVLCDPKKNKGKRIVGAPDLLMEVLSPDTRPWDMVYKLNMYMNGGVKEYWIIDPDENEVLVYDADGTRIGKRYSFEEKIPLGISGGELEIDLSERIINPEEINDEDA